MKHIKRFKMDERFSIDDLEMDNTQKEFVEEVKSDYMDLVSEITTDFGDVLVMLKSKLINTDMYNRLHPLINKYKLSFGMSYYQGDNRLMLRHFKGGPVHFSNRELWGPFEDDE